MADLTPGAFPQTAPYGMKKRVEDQTGMKGPKAPGQPRANPGMPGMTSSFGTGRSSAPAGPSTLFVGKQAGAMADPLGGLPGTATLIGGGKAVKPGMAIVQKPKSPMVRIASEFPSIDECRSALGLDVKDGICRLITKEGQKARLLEVIGAYQELQASKDEAEKVACIVRLAELRKEAWAGQLLRGALTAGAMVSPLGPSLLAYKAGKMGLGAMRSIAPEAMNKVLGPETGA